MGHIPGHLPGRLPEFDVWRERQRELVREAEERRVARGAREARGSRKPSVSLRGFVAGLAAMVRPVEARFAARGRRCEE